MPNKKGELTEDELLRAVIDIAHLHGWRVAHFRPAQTQRGNWVTPVMADGKGFFDLVLVRNRVLFVELKSQKGRLSPEQRDWADAVAKTGGATRVWRPSDLPEIAEILK